MDPISHAVFGYTIVTAVRRPAAATSGCTSAAVATVLGALAPDVDAVFMPTGWDLYLRVHEVGTHALLGTFPVALAVALVVRTLGSATAPVRPPKKPSATLITLLVAAWIGTLSHVVLDVVSGARIKVAWPLADERTHVPLVAMGEPWLVGLFVVGLLTVILARERRRGMAITLLMAVAAFLTVKSLWLYEAVRTLDLVDAVQVQRQVIEARWATLREWNVFQATDGTLRHLMIQPGLPPTLLASWLTAPTSAESPVVARSRSLDTVRNFLAVHELPFAREAADERGDTDVLWSDIRFCRAPAAEQDVGVAPTMSSVATPLTDRAQLLMTCGLWFGGTYDQMGRALRQWVRVGGWLQTRSAGP